MLPTTTALYSADDHVIEPAHLWVDRVPERFKDRCPRIVDPGNGRQAWLFEDELVYIPMGSCRPLEGLPVQGFPPAPGTARFDEIRPGCYDPVARVADMDIDGVWGQLCFPNYARFAGHRFYLNVPDRDLGYACLRTYNDYLLDEWCATVMGLPSIHTDHWDPILAVAREAGLPICMHIGSSSRLITTSADAPATVLTSLNGLNSMCAGVDWLLGGVLERFPGLNVVLSEGGAGWVPYVLERADKAFFDHRMDTNLEVGQKFKGKVPPSQLFAEQMYVCLVDEHFALRALGDIPVDNLLWEGDFPHGDGLWPDNRSTMEKSLVDVPDGDAVKIMETNFRRVFGIR